METIKKTLVVFGAVVIAMLMVSTATAVPQVQSKPVMDKIEQTEKANNLPFNQDALNKLLSGNVNEADLNSIAEQLNNFLVEQGISEVNLQEQMNTNTFTLSDFIDYFTSMEFANLFMNSDIQNLLNSQNYNSFYNNDSVQTYLNSDEFAAFMNTDIAQQFLANINGGGSSNPQSQETSSVVNQVNTVVVGQKASATSNNAAVEQTSINNVATGQNVVAGVESTTTVGTTPSLQIGATSTDKFNLFAGLFLGIFAYILGGPEPGLFFFIFEALLIIAVVFALTLGVSIVLGFFLAPIALVLGVIALVVLAVLAIIAIPLLIILLPFIIIWLILYWLTG
jgi:hypothetical protein